MVVRYPTFIVNLCGLLFVPAGHQMEMEDYCHEDIHTAQMQELGYIGFYIIYFLEWVYRLIFHTKTAYRGISFEREAYEHEADGWLYLKRRKHYAQWRKK